MDTAKFFFKDLYNKSSIFGELLQFLWENKLWWSIPVIVVILVVMMLVVFAQGTGLAPFIYPLF